MQRVELTDEDEDSDQEEVVNTSFKVAEQVVNLSWNSLNSTNGHIDLIFLLLHRLWLDV